MPGATVSIIGEIEAVLNGSSAAKRIQILMSVTDLFIGAAPKYTPDETVLFDDVLGHLIEQVEKTALAELSRRLAPIPNAPAGIIRSLAFDDAIEVSGPVLNQSVQLRDEDLIVIAESKSQTHLANIARRVRLNEPVTEALVDNGDATVANEVAANTGARFSELAMAKLVMRADGDDRLSGAISQRSDISPDNFRRLLLQATKAVRTKFLALANPGHKDMVRKILDEISAQNYQAPATPLKYSEARLTVSGLGQDTEQIKVKILQFAVEGRVAETIAALSVLSKVPIEQVDSLFHSANSFGLMTLCKATAMDWNTAVAVIQARQDDSSTDGLLEQYEKLSIASAQKLMHFWMGRQSVKRNF
jgi:uncharacterized protein (DUF2336 family)